MYLSGFSKPQAPEPIKNRPAISDPLPGSGRIIPDSAHGAVPPNPAPAPRPGIPNNEYPHSSLVDIHSLGWPANNRNTNKLHDLKQAHTQSLKDLNDARLSRPYLTAENKDKKSEIHVLEKAERQAKRNVDVFKIRYSRELKSEAEYRSSRPGWLGRAM